VLTVSTFFTLSGFLITRLLLREVDDRGGIDLRRFYVQRFRRLMPAAVVALLAITLLWRVGGEGERTVAQGDVLSALAYVANWWSLHIDRTYADLFGAASPVQHFWSLSIEEQFYLAFPLVLLAAVRLVRKTSLVVLPLAAVTVALFAWGGHVAGGDVSRAYYGTDARAAEFLAGAALAALVAVPGVEAAARRAVRSGLGVATGVVAFVALVAGWMLVTYQHEALFPWGVAANAALTGVVIVAVLERSPVTSLLATRPAVAMGKVSYGMYLIHWPVFLLLTPAETGLSGAPLFGLRFAVTAGLAAVLYGVVEQPIRRRRLFTDRAFGWASGVAVAAVLAVLAVPVDAPPATAFDPGEMAAARERVLRGGDLGASVAVAPRPATVTTTARPPTAPLDVEATTTTTAAAATPRPPRILVIGDSISWTVASGLRPWGSDNGLSVEVFHAVGCGLAGDTPIRYLGIERDESDDCRRWWDDLPVAVEMFRPSVVLVVGGMADLSDRHLPDGAWSHIGEPAYDAWLAGRYGELVDVLSADGALVAWASLPGLRAPYQPGLTGRPPFDENDPARVARLNELLTSLAAADERVELIDFAAYSRERPGGEFDRRYRPDGVHLDARSALEVAPWFGIQMVALLQR
jgi:peptidoglycan/LPS O-acetylase OafA/YrhL